MTDKPNPMNKPIFPKIDIDTDALQRNLDDIRNQAQEALRNPQGPERQQIVEDSKSFYERNKKVILTGVGVVVLLKVNKRKVAKATAKAVAKELKKSQASQLPTMMDILRDLRTTPGMAYVDHGGQLLHLLRDHNTVVTIAGDFANMNTDQIWDYAQKTLSNTSFKLKTLS